MTPLMTPAHEGFSVVRQADVRRKLEAGEAALNRAGRRSEKVWRSARGRIGADRNLLENHLQAEIASEVQRLLQAAEPAIHPSRAAPSQVRIGKRSSTIMISAAPAMIMGMLTISPQAFPIGPRRGAWIDPHGYDAGKKIKGKKRHILVDTVGLLLHAVVHPADIQDRDGGVLVMSTLFGTFPFLKKLFADSGYQGPKFAKALAKVLPHLDIEIVKRSDQVSGFAVLPKRWIVERTIAWLNRCRRLAKDWENLNRKALAFLRLASIRLMLRKLCNPA